MVTLTITPVMLASTMKTYGSVMGMGVSVMVSEWVEPIGIFHACSRGSSRVVARHAMPWLSAGQPWEQPAGGPILRCHVDHGSRSSRGLLLLSQFLISSGPVDSCWFLFLLVGEYVGWWWPDSCWWRQKTWLWSWSSFFGGKGVIQDLRNLNEDREYIVSL